MVGIVGYGAYVPSGRIKVSEIADAWGKNGEEVSASLGAVEKAVASVDEDAVSLAVESAYQAVENSQVLLNDIEAILVGSESHPYVVKPSSTIVAEILGLPNNYLAADLEFACKAGTAGLQLISGLVSSGQIKYGMAIGSDVAQAKSGDVLEYTAGSASASYILGTKKIIAKILGMTSFSSNTPDFWRRDGQKFPSHAGRFTGEPAYFAHVLGASFNLLKKMKMKPDDFDHVVFHMPNGKFPKEAAKKLGFSEKQLEAGFTVKDIGNPYSASTMVGLAAVLDIAKPNQKIFVCSYGSGAGSDAFVFQTTPEITNYQRKIKKTVSSQIENKRYLNYLDVNKLYLTKGAT